MFRFIKSNNKGITLLSLVITVIVLIILASISLATLTGENGIIQKAQEAKNAAESSGATDNQVLKNIIDYSNELGGNSTTNPGQGNTTDPGDGGSTDECAHVWDAGVISKEATCTETGLKTYTCTVCGGTKTEDVAAKGHNYKSEVTTPATETTDGVMTHTCQNCGDSYPTVIPAEGTEHICSYTEKNTASTYLKTEATCTSPAEYYYSCTCGEKGTATFTDGSSTGHNYVDEQAVARALRSSATCTADATYWYECEWCTAHSSTKYWIDEDSALGHDFTEEDASDTYLKSEATCTSAAVYYKSCTRCGEKGTATFTSGSFSKHLWVGGYCENCGVECSHESVAVEPDYVSDSSTQHQVRYSCEVCGGAISATLENHDWVDGTCSRCKYSCSCEYTKTYEQLDSAYHTEYGTCNICGSTYNVSGLHVYSDGVCGMCSYTCTHPSMGSSTGICAYCNEVVNNN